MGSITHEILITCEIHNNISFAVSCVFIPRDEFLKLPFFKPPECLHGSCTLTSAKPFFFFFLLKKNNSCLLSLHTFPICLENHMLSLLSCQRFSFSHTFIKEKNCNRTLFSQVFHQLLYILNPYTFTGVFPWKPESNSLRNLLGKWAQVKMHLIILAETSSDLVLAQSSKTVFWVLCQRILEEGRELSSDIHKKMQMLASMLLWAQHSYTMTFVPVTRW